MPFQCQPFHSKMHPVCSVKWLKLWRAPSHGNHAKAGTRLLIQSSRLPTPTKQSNRCQYGNLVLNDDDGKADDLVSSLLPTTITSLFHLHLLHCVLAFYYLPSLQFIVSSLQTISHFPFSFHLITLNTDTSFPSTHPVGYVTWNEWQGLLYLAE